MPVFIKSVTFTYLLVTVTEIYMLFIEVLSSGQRGNNADLGHAYSARYLDGKLLYEGTTYDVNQRIVIETRGQSVQ